MIGRDSRTIFIYGNCRIMLPSARPLTGPCLILTIKKRKLSTCFSNPSTVNLFNSQIRQSADRNNGNKALSLFRQMKQNGLEPNNLTFPFISKACAKLCDLKCSQMVHTHALKSPFYGDVFVQTALLDMYVKCDRLDMAFNVFVQMPERDVASWNAMLAGFGQIGFWDNVFGVFREMRFAGVLPDAVTVMEVSRVVSCMNRLEWAKGVHSFGIRIGIDSDISVANTWISVYAKCGDLGLAELVFDGIEVCLRSLVSWNSMIAGYANFEKCFDALKSYKCMLEDGFWPDISTFVSLLSSCAQPEAVFQGMLVHSHGIRVGCDVDVCVVNTLISMYSKCGDLDSARYLFDSMPERSCVSWTTMISGYAKMGNMDQMLTLFNAMEASGQKPDLVTVLSVIAGCAQTGALRVGKWIDAYADSNGLKRNLVVCNALIDMYAKCGSIHNARELFCALPDRTVVSWTTMIAGCALNGLFEEAVDLFYQMMELALEPNHITFLAVLQACNHAGFLEKGWDFFNVMTKVYRINPGLDHYSCLADLLGRRGKLKEALDFIQDMPIKPDAAIWSSLLGACKIHHNIDIGEHAARNLFELDPNAAAPYVEMANIYASAGRWDEVAKLRAIMKCNKVKKSPGQSHVEVNGKTYAFTVEGRDHSGGDMLYAALDSLMLQSKEEELSPFSIGTVEHDLESSFIFNM